MPPSNFTDDLPTEREPSDLRGDSIEYSYIWSTTGSGKTLTSFNASTFLKDNPDIVKCLFVVDRKDLDRQTREEFNRFQEGCVEENTNTQTFLRHLYPDIRGEKETWLPS